MLSSPLPNDLARNPPWPHLIATWPINDAFLAGIEEAEARLAELGYYLKYGVEINLRPLSPAEVEDYGKRRYGPRLIAWREAARTQFRRDLAQAQKTPFFAAGASEIYAQLERLAEQHRKKPRADSKAWLTNWTKAQDFYRHAQTEKIAKKTALAQKDFMLGALHLLPQHLGGLDQLIEQRFASEHYGFGWWDGTSIAELRTLPVGGAENAIAHSHHVLWRLKHGVEHLGFVPDLGETLMQVHFSLWRAADDTNIMACDDEESVALRLRMADCATKFFNHYGAGFSRIRGENPLNCGPLVGSSRMSLLRTCKDNWELRLPHYFNGVTHLARDLYFINEIVATACAPSSPVSVPVPVLRQSKDRAFIGLRFKDTGSYASPHPAKIIRRVSIKADPVRVACPFVSCLENGVLGEDGRIDVPDAVFDGNWSILQEAIGKYCVDLFAFHDPKRHNESAYNLTTRQGLREMFRRLRIADDGTIDASALHPLLARHFAGLLVASTRPDVHIKESPFMEHIAFDLMREMNTYFVSRGAILEGHEAMSKAELEIYRFAHDANRMLDVEDGAHFLAAIYRGAAEKKTGEQLPETGLKNFVDATWGRPLTYAMLYRSGKLGETVMPAFGDDYILDLMLSHRLHSAKAIPELLRTYGAGKDFFRHMRRGLENPDELYTLRRILPSLEEASFVAALTLMNQSGKEQKVPQEDNVRMEKTGISIGESMITTLGASQDDPAHSTEVLRQFVRQARILTHPERHVRKPPDFGGLKIEFERPQNLQALQINFMGGLRKGIIEGAKRFAADPALLVEMRRRADETLKGMQDRLDATLAAHLG